MLRFFGLLGSGPFDIHRRLPHEDALAKFLKYGTKTYGMYQGDKQAVVTVDLEIIKSVLVKNMDSFDEMIELPQVEQAQNLIVSLQSTPIGSAE